MKSLLRLAVLALALSPLSAFAAAVPGSVAPDFTAMDITGQQVKLSDFKGKYVVLEWTNHECPFVKKHYGSGNMQALQKKYTGQGVVWISIISSAEGSQGYVTDAEAQKLVTADKSSASHVVRDPSGTIGRMYDAKTTPHMFIVNKDGKLAYVGAIDSKATTEIADIPQAENYLDRAFSELTAGKPVSMASTRSYGCGVKYKD